MKLVIKYIDIISFSKFRIEKIDVPFNDKKLSLQEMDVCDTLASKNCKDDELIMSWKLEEEE